MKEFVITANDIGRRLDKYVFHILINAPHSFTYKMLRKKNIVLNENKATGSEILKEGDCIKIYLSDETFDKFSLPANEIADVSSMMPGIVYEDDDLLLVNKPSGMLTQRSEADDISLNDICLSYLKKTCSKFDETIKTFTPSICNRLDRNTSGIVIFGKTYKGARAVSEVIREHTIGKYYKCVVCGIIDKDIILSGILEKDEATNTVSINNTGMADSNVKTIVRPISSNKSLTLTDIELITGKTHQIRAHMASVGHPVLGDPKYGDRSINRSYKEKYGIDSQMLVCYKLVFPDFFPLENVSGRTFEIELPSEFNKVIR